MGAQFKFKICFFHLIFVNESDVVRSLESRQSSCYNHSKLSLGKQQNNANHNKATVQFAKISRPILFTCKFNWFLIELTIAVNYQL